MIPHYILIQHKTINGLNYLDETAKVVEELNRFVDHIKRLEREVELLRLYGNKDCTAMADDALRKEAKP